MPEQDNNSPTGIPPEFLKRLQITPEDQLQQDIRFVRNLLPHYVIQESKKKGSIHCTSSLGGINESPEYIWEGVFNRLKNYFGDRFQEIFHSTCANHCDFTIYLKTWPDPTPGVLEQLQKSHIAQYPRTPEEAFKLVDQLGKKDDGEKELIKEEDLVPEITALMREADRRFHDGNIGGSTRHYVRDVLIPLMKEKGLCFCRIIK